MKPSENPLGSEPVSTLLRRFAVPSVIAMLVSALYNMVDQLFIGHSIGVLGNAATNVAFPLSMVCTSIGLLCGIGGAANFNLCMGRREPEHAKSYVGNAISMLAILGVILCVAVQLFLRPMMLLFGATPDVIDYACTYTRITSIGFPFLIVTIGGSNLIRADGSPKFSMLCNLVGAIVNTILDPLFIFVLGLGVRGAALATVISQAVSAVWVMTFLTGKKTRWYLKRENLHVDAKIVLPCIALGLSPFVMQSTESLIAICFNSSLLRYGGDMAVGTMTVLTSIMQFSNMPLQGLTQGAQPIVSYNFGAKNVQRVRDAYFCLLRACFTYSMAIWLLVELFPRAFILIFNNDPALVEYAAWAVRIYMGCSGIFGIQIACQQTFVALGNAKTSLFLAVWRKIILLIPLIYILPHFFADKAFAVFLAEPLADFGAVALTSFTFYRQFRRSMRELEGAEATGER